MRMKNCGSEEFIDKLKGRRVICFGAGLRMIRADYAVKNIEDHIAFFVDNDEKKQGLKFQYLGHGFDIKSPEVLKSIDPKDYVLLITCVSHTEIYDQLKDIAELGDLECYIYEMICRCPQIDIERFFTEEIQKHAFHEWKQILKSYNLKNKHKGKRCFLIGNGPSLRPEDLDLLKGEITFAANRIYMLFNKTEWRPTYYFCADSGLYSMDHRKIRGIDAELRFVSLNTGILAGKVYDEVTYYNQGMNFVEVKQGKVVFKNKVNFSYDAEKVVYGGGTILYDALQWAVYMGFSEVYLLGVDCNYKFERTVDGKVIENDIKKEHFDEKYDVGRTWAAEVFRLIMAWEQAKKSCEERGIVIKNATRGGKLEVFERVSLEELVKAPRD